MPGQLQCKPSLFDLFITNVRALIGHDPSRVFAVKGSTYFHMRTNHFCRASSLFSLNEIEALSFVLPPDDLCIRGMARV